jgi:hypothetical protein
MWDFASRIEAFTDNLPDERPRPPGEKDDEILLPPARYPYKASIISWTQ